MSVEFLFTSLVIAVIPGTGVVYTLASSLGGGLRRGLVASFGCTLGIVPHIAAAILGLSGVMQIGAAAFEVVRWAGVVYLVYMGISMIREGGTLLVGEEEAPPEPFFRVIRRGILLNLLNPKLTAFFFAFLPQFLTSRPGLLDPHLLLLSGVFMGITFVVFALYACASTIARDLILGSMRVRRWIQRLLGTLLIALAARLAFTER